MKPLSYICFFAFCTFIAKANATSKKDEFWLEASTFVEVIEDRGNAYSKLTKLSALSKPILESSLVRLQLFEVNVQYLKIYGSLRELENYYNKHLHHFSEGHVFYISYYADYIMLHQLLNKSSELKKLLGELKTNPADSKNIFYLAINLFLNSKKKNYEKLMEVCSNECNFSLYHISIMQYLKSNEHYKELEDYAKNLLNGLISNNLMVSNIFFPQYVMAYYSFASKKMSKDDLSKKVFASSIEKAGEGSFIYKQLVNIMRE